MFKNTIKLKVFIVHNAGGLKKNFVFPLSKLQLQDIRIRLSPYLTATLHYKSLNALPAEQWEVALEDFAALTQVSTTLEKLSAAPRRTVNE
jgi:hypothetical protein